MKYFQYSLGQRVWFTSLDNAFCGDKTSVPVMGIVIGYQSIKTCEVTDRGQYRAGTSNQYIIQAVDPTFNASHKIIVAGYMVDKLAEVQPTVDELLTSEHSLLRALGLYLKKVEKNKEKKAALKQKRGW